MSDNLKPCVWIVERRTSTTPWMPILSRVFMTLKAARTFCPQDNDSYRVRQYMRVEERRV